MDNAWSGEVNEAVLADYTKFKISKYYLYKHKTKTFEELKLEARARGTIFLISFLIFLYISLI